MSAGDVYEDVFLDVALGSNHSALFPASVYFALFTAETFDDGTGTEMSGSGYARVLLANNSTNFPDADSAIKTNGVDIVFPAATADWPTIGWWAIMDAASGGNFIFHGSFVEPRAVASGVSLTILAGYLSIVAD